MTSGWYPDATRLPITTSEYWAQRTETLNAIVCHITDGTDSRDFLQNADNLSSVHFLVRDENGVGVVYQFMPVEWAAWGNGIVSKNNPYTPAWLAQKIAAEVNPNMLSVSIEHERKWPFTTMPSEAMIEASIKLQKWLCDNYPTIKRDREHIIGHYQIDHIIKANCPGGPGGKLFPFDRVVAALNNTPAPNPDVRYFPETGHSVGHGFLGYFDAHGGIAVFGYPLTEEIQEQVETWVGTVQYFEKARFEYHSELNPPQVLTGRIGAELLELK